MEKNRLIAFGCSLTYGHGLPDCHEPPKQPGNTHSNMGWPSIISKYMDRECINMSSPGSSNKKIWNTITNFNFKSDDIVFIQWSYIERTAILKKDQIIDLGPWSENSYYETYDTHDSTLMSKLFVSHSNMFLELKNIKVYNIVPGKNELTLLRFKDTLIDHIPVYLTRMRELYPLALDKRHPGVECQIMYSKEILKFLDISNDLHEYKPFNTFGKIKRNIEFMRNN